MTEAGEFKWPAQGKECHLLTERRSALFSSSSPEQKGPLLCSALSLLIPDTVALHLVLGEL